MKFNNGEKGRNTITLATFVENTGFLNESGYEGKNINQNGNEKLNRELAGNIMKENKRTTDFRLSF